jgi:hypothetical protein
MHKTLSKYIILIDTALEAHEVVVVMAASNLPFMMEVMV